MPPLLSLLALCAVSCSSAGSTFVIRTKPTRPAAVAPTPPSASPLPTTEPTTSADIEAALRRWLAAANKAFATGDTRDLRACTEKKCACVSLAKAVERYWAHGSIRGLTWTLRSVHLVDIRVGLADIQFEFDEPTYWVVRSGRLSSPHRADRVGVLAEFELTHGVWRMLDYTRLKSTPR